MNQRASDLGMTRTAYFTKLITYELDTHFLSGSISTIDVEGSLIRFREEIEQEIQQRFHEMKSQLLQELRVSGQVTGSYEKKEEFSYKTHKSGRNTTLEDYIDKLPRVTRTSVEPVLQTIIDSSKHLTRKEIAELMGVSENSIRRPLDRLIADNIIAKNKNGRSFTYFLKL